MVVHGWPGHNYMHVKILSVLVVAFSELQEQSMSAWKVSERSM